MLPRFHLMSALAATMSEEDAPVVPSPEPDDAALADMRTRAAERMSALEQGMREASARADEAAGRYASLDAAPTSAVGGSLNMIGGPGNGRNLYREYITRTERQSSVSLGGYQHTPWSAAPEFLRAEHHNEQQASKRARAKRKAKRGWA